MRHINHGSSTLTCEICEKFQSSDEFARYIGYIPKPLNFKVCYSCSYNLISMDTELPLTGPRTVESILSINVERFLEISSDELKYSYYKIMESIEVYSVTKRRNSWLRHCGIRVFAQSKNCETNRDACR
jgi:hypothetical protein